MSALFELGSIRGGVLPRLQGYAGGRAVFRGPRFKEKVTFYRNFRFR
jgi:hypothetical protein